MMKINASSPATYIQEVDEARRPVFEKLRETIVENIPDGFQECMSYGMIGYVVPHSIYPKGYHCDPKTPLPFINLGAQKNYISMHHMGLYGDPKLLDWFVSEYPKHSKSKLDMGKGCVRFKRPDDIPFDLIAELLRKVSVEDYVGRVEMSLMNREKKSV